MTEREAIHPEQAVELYLDHRRGEVSETTLKAHEYRLSHFIRWCDERDITDTDTLDGRLLADYKSWRRDDGDLNAVTLKTQMHTLRVFIRFLERIEGVRNDLSERILVPSIEKGKNQRNVKLDSDAAKALLTYLSRFEYASLQHVLMTLLWRCGVRSGSARAIDVDDYDRNDQRLAIRHRPDTGTPLKNHGDGERLIALQSDTCEILDDWIEVNRPAVTDDDGREPLLATTHGRLSPSSLRRYVYRTTRPCTYGECPHGRERDACEALGNGGHDASKCPDSVASHAIRRGSITHFLANDVPEKVVSDRMNVSRDVLDDHYDRRTEQQKVEQRRGYLDNL